MKEIKGILQAIDFLVKQSVDIIDSKEHCRDRLLGYPIQYVPTDMLKRYLKKFDDMNVFNPSYDHEVVLLCNRELEQREAYNIIVSKNEEKQ